MTDKAAERPFQKAIVGEMAEAGWEEVLATGCHCDLELYPDERLAWLRKTQHDEVKRLTKFYHDRTDAMNLKRVAGPTLRDLHA